MPIIKSGFNYPNKLGYILVKAIKETIGEEATQAIFNLADIPESAQNPPNNYAKVFDFAYFGAILDAFNKMYGRRGERALSLRVGRNAYYDGLGEYGPLVGASEIPFKMIPLSLKMKLGLTAMAKTFSTFSDQETTVTEADDYLIYTIKKCSICWGRSSTIPICYAAIGMIEEGLKWISNGKLFRIEEVACHAVGDDHCVFYIYKEPLD